MKSRSEFKIPLQSYRIASAAFGILAMTGVLMLSSCTTVGAPKPDHDAGAHIGSIPRPYEEVWKATMLALDQYLLDSADHDRGFVQTSWIKGWGDKKFGALAGLGSGGSWQRRARAFVWLHPDGSATAVKVRLDVEEKPPGGAMANRWSRTAVEPEQVKDLFRQIETECLRIKPSA